LRQLVSSSSFAIGAGSATVTIADNEYLVVAAAD